MFDTSTWSTSASIVWKMPLTTGFRELTTRVMTNSTKSVATGANGRNSNRVIMSSVMFFHYLEGSKGRLAVYEVVERCIPVAKDKMNPSSLTIKAYNSLLVITLT
jgi:hypothetical protein